jgi:hypothetical protein
MFIYVYDKQLQQWIEASILYPHDIALLIDNKAKKVYLWFGDRSEEETQQQAERQANEVMDKYKMYDYIVLTDVIPLKVQAEIEDLLGDQGDPRRNKMERTIPIRLFVIGGFLGIIIALVLVINNLRMLFWETSSGITEVDMWAFNEIFLISIIIGDIAIGIFALNLVFAGISKKIFLIVCATACLGIVIGTVFYLQQREFIFEFQEGTPAEYIYFIAQPDIMLHIFWLVLVLVGISVPLWYCINQIKTTTESKPKAEKVILPEQLGYSVMGKPRIGLKKDQTAPPK